MDENCREDVVVPVHCQPIMRRKGDTAVSPFLSPMMKKILICISLLVLFGMAHAEEKKTDVPIGDSPSTGPADAPVTLVEFIDFQ
jgi:hypothetical protein